MLRLSPSPQPLPPTRGEGLLSSPLPLRERGRGEVSEPFA